MSLFCTVCEILPLVCELTAYVTRHDLEKHFHSNAAIEAVAQAIVVVSFVGDICCIFETLSLERRLVAEMTFQVT